MKILMLGWELPPHNSGGLGTACQNICRALAKRDVDIDFVLPYKASHDDIDFMRILPATSCDPLFRFGGGTYDTIYIDDPIIPAPTLKKTDTHITIRDIQKKYCDFVMDYLSTNKVDLIVAHDWLTFEAAIMAKNTFRVPFIAHIHATEYDRAGGSKGNPLVSEIESCGLAAADHIVAVSSVTKTTLIKNYQIEESKISVAYNALDQKFLEETSDFDPDRYIYLDYLKKSGYTIVSTVGRFTIQKGLWHFLNAARLALEKNPKLFFILAGDGEERDALISQAVDLCIEDHVAFTGFIRGKKLYDIYSLTDIFVMSSISEPFGLTALEAAHYDDALILTKQSGVSEVLPSAIKYNYWDEISLADEIVSFSSSAKKIHSNARLIHAECDHLDWDDVAKKYLKIYKTIAK